MFARTEICQSILFELGTDYSFHPRKNDVVEVIETCHLGCNVYIPIR